MLFSVQTNKIRKNIINIVLWTEFIISHGRFQASVIASKHLYYVGAYFKTGNISADCWIFSIINWCEERFTSDNFVYVNSRPPPIRWSDAFLYILQDVKWRILIIRDRSLFLSMRKTCVHYWTVNSRSDDKIFLKWSLICFL